MVENMLFFWSQQRLPFRVGDGECDGSDCGIWDDERDRLDEGNRITYSGIDFMNEGLGGRGGAGVQSKTEQPGMTCLLLKTIRTQVLQSRRHCVISYNRKKKLKKFYLSAPSHCEYQLAAAPGPPWFLEYCTSRLGPRVPGLNLVLFQGGRRWISDYSCQGKEEAVCFPQVSCVVEEELGEAEQQLNPSLSVVGCRSFKSPVYPLSHLHIVRIKTRWEQVSWWADDESV